MSDFPIDRRGLVAGAAFATLFAAAARAEDKPLSPWEWTDEIGRAHV